MFNLKILRPPEELELIKRIFPEKPLTEKLIADLLKLAKKPLLETLRAEIEIYKQYPKKGRMDKLTFNPTNHKSCFMGQGFKVSTESNYAAGDAWLSEYRSSIGTINHGEWGNCTLLEAWAGDHFKRYPEMVKAVFSYCRGDRTTLPIIKFHIFPLFKNKDSGRTSFDDVDKESDMDRYLIEVNGLLAQYGRKPMKELKGDFLKDFEEQWRRKNTSL